LKDLVDLYNKCDKKTTYLANHLVTYYQYITFQLKVNDGCVDFIRISLNVGDFIEIEEESFGKSYAKIRAFLHHKGNDNRLYAFVIIDWMEKLESTDPILGCSYYKLQEFNNHKWKRLFPISILGKSSQPIHFVHNCEYRKCQDGSHDIVSNNVYIHNEYIFTAI
jgi:hypothetical protein